MKDEGPLAEDTRTRGAGTPTARTGLWQKPSAGVGRAPGARPAGQEAAGPAADWLRRWAEVMLLSVAPPAPGKPRVSAGWRLRWRQRQRQQ